jgi:phage baseplate assembly protein W
MPIPQIIRIDPRDLDKNKAVGISLPFNGGGVFKSTFSTKDQIKSNLINLLLTYKGERVLNPEFGADLPRLLFEVISNETYIKIQDQIISSIATYIPEVTLTNIEITPSIDKNSLYINISYQIKLSGTSDNIIIDFSTLQ